MGSISGTPHRKYVNFPRINYLPKILYDVLGNQLQGSWTAPFLPPVSVKQSFRHCAPDTIPGRWKASVGSSALPSFSPSSFVFAIPTRLFNVFQSDRESGHSSILRTHRNYFLHPKTIKTELYLLSSNLFVWIFPR